MLFADQFLQHVNSLKLIQPGAKLLVAVSGGADSMALLYALYHARRDLGLRLIVAHYDHSLRASSVLDRSFVKQVAARLGLPFLTEINRRATPRKGSIEEYARDLRYDFLFRMAVKHEASAVLTAHTRDDLAETVLMRILRGTGLAGLQAILPRRTVSGCELVRPMLVFSRAEVEAYLKGLKVKFRNDPTNRSLDFERNKVRKILIPYLAKNFNPGVKDNLARLADIAALDQAYIEEQAGLFIKARLKVTASEVSIPLEALKGLHGSMRRTVLRAMVMALHGDTRPLSLAHIISIDQALFSEGSGTAFVRRPLPAGLVFINRSGRLILSRKKHLSYP
ncbi:MAG: tRNA lysidine(34) synthetase TilS [Candidatus Omnitrophica bacterium]|nr:tRNA lysidine(34) synthetase TilS [Candidatus Omnitrophota bacterium]